jgi:hypothetical protein
MRSADHRFRRRLDVVLGAAAAVPLAIGSLAISLLPSEHAAAAAAHGATQPHEEVDSFEATLTFEEPDGSTITWAIRASDDDYEVEITAEEIDGDVEHAAVTMVGDLTYITTADGGNVVSPRQPGDGLNPPVADLAQAVISALENSDVSRSGTEVIAGSVTTRYEVELNDRSIAAFSDPVPIVSQDVTRLTIWIGGEYPRQLEMETAAGYRESLTFHSIGGAVTISEPSGDYAFDPDPDLGVPIDVGR